MAYDPRLKAGLHDIIFNTGPIENFGLIYTTSMSQPNTSAEGAPKQPAGQDGIDIPKIQSLLKSKDDTQRFVGLALLKSVLDNSPQVREDEEAIQGLWSSLSSKFLDRLLKTGSKRSNENAKEMLDLVVSILHTFAVLLPAQALGKSKFVDRIPRLVSVVLYRYV